MWLERHLPNILDGDAFSVILPSLSNTSFKAREHLLWSQVVTLKMIVSRVMWLVSAVCCRVT